MSEPNSFEGLKLLHADLLAVSESRLLDLERLLAQLHAHTEEFRGLLDKNARNEQSRQALATGRLEIGDTVYGVNEEFQQGALQLADELNLDELVAAEIFFDATDDGASFGRTALESGIIKFHQQRQYLLDCLRMILEQSANVDQEERIRVPLQNVIVYILQPPGEAANSPDNSSKFLRKCYSSMEDIRSWLQKLADKLNSASVLGQGQRQEVLETIEFQRRSLVQQHESLGVIVLYLVKTSRGNVSDFEVMVEVVRKMDRYDNLLVHYFPTLGAFISRFGAPEGGGSLEVARALNAKLFGQTDSNPWALQYVYAAFKAWWLAEYSGWYNETYGEHAVAGVNLEEESKQRSKQFTEALKDGAFDFLMSLSADAKAAEWNDPARHGLRDWLQHKAPQLVSDSIYFSDFFQDVLMEQLESFIDGFITNLPDVLRRLRIDEDEQRQLNQRHEHDVDLERFLVIISYAFEGRPKAAMEAFWGVQDGALLGFIHWASRRASTPLVSAFCEMLQALSEDEDCATAAHEFLLDDAGHTSGMMRRSQSLTWSQIFRELTFFSEKIRDRPAIPQSQSYRAGNPNNDQVETEPESAMMLECYLRLIARLSAESELARQYLLQHPTFRLVEMLLQFASSDILPRLRACAFTALSRLLSHKNRPTGEHIWASLDHWISGGYAPGSHLSKSSPPSETRKSSAASNRIFEEIGRGFEQPNAFIQLLIALVSPYEDEESINDSLSFPENLGSATRMPGIDPYIDFAVGHIFGGRLADRLDTVEQRLLQLTCLEFISACLTTFNEDLVIFANQSNVQVDAAINTSNLAAYVCLHPFSRVMEWVFSDAVMSALFSAIHQNISDVATARPSSPILLCLLSSIRVVTLIMDLQYTYLDIIRPLIKLQPTHRRHHVSNAAFASFEDGVLNNLSVIADLGLYCGLGHPELTIASLGLLERLSASPKLASTSTAGMGRRVDRNKVIAALETNNDAESISRSLVREMDEMFDPEQGSDSSTYKIKIHILDFLLACLRVSPGRPTIAHLLLGFQCKVDYLDIDPEGPFSQGSSLFHSILKLALTLEDPEALDGSSDIFLLLASLKTKALLILKQLWTSPLSANLTMEVLQANNAPFWLFNQEAAIEPKALCDGLDVADPRFLMSPAASCLSELLSRRSIVFQYISAELRSLVRSNSTSLKNRVVETLLGSTTQADGTRTQNASVFELFDFMEFDLSYVGQLSDMTWFGDINFAVCLEDPNDPESVYNLTKVEELLILRQAELVKANRLTNPQDTVQLQVQAQTLMQFLASHNQKTNLRVRKLDVLRSWVQLMVVVTNTWGSDDSTKISFVLQALQTVMPRLENSLENAPEAMELAQLAKALLFSLEFGSESFKNSDLGDMASDRLLHLFQLSLKAIGSPLSNASLKETFYGICYRYLTGMSDAAGILGLSRRHSTQTIKAAGERLIDIICDDAYAGDRTCRIAALLLLACLVKLGNKEGSKYVIESLERLNFISILVDSLRNITKELRGTPREDVSIQLSYCNARLALLLQLSQTRHGATVVLKSGLFHAVEASGLFKADPDLGVDIDDADAVSKHYDLLAAIVRVLCAAVLSRGRENQQTIDQARKFISENRTSILAVFKRSAGLSTGGKVAEKSIEDLTESFMLLISATEFLDFDEKAILKPLPKKSFT